MTTNLIPIALIKEKAYTISYLDKHYPSLKFKRSGNVYQGNCPFHKEKTGSFTIFPNGTYKCFGCGEYGDIITFIMKTEKLEFKEACQMIAENVGVDYELTPPNPYHEQYKDTMDQHSRRYYKNLLQSKDALDYLKVNRQFTDETILKFRLGLVPSDEYKYRSDLGNIGDRIAFPILEHKLNNKAKTVGMGYRTLKNEKPKYINDHNQEGKPAIDNKPAQDPNLNGVFIKGQYLYGYSLAYKAIKDSNHAIVVEGYTDVVSLNQSNVLNSVASLGTALTEFQMDTLRKLTPNIIFFYDGDNAGITNMIKLLPKLLEKGFNVKMVVAEGGLDPSDVCIKYNFVGADVRNYINSSCKSAVLIMIDKATKDYEKFVVKERSKALAIMNPILDVMSNQAERKVFENMLNKKLDM